MEQSGSQLGRELIKGYGATASWSALEVTPLVWPGRRNVGRPLLVAAPPRPFSSNSGPDKLQYRVDGSADTAGYLNH